MSVQFFFMQKKQSDLLTMREEIRVCVNQYCRLRDVCCL